MHFSHEFEKLKCNANISTLSTNYDTEIKDMLKVGMCNSIKQIKKINIHYKNWVKCKNKIINNKIKIDAFNLSNNKLDNDVVSYIKEYHYKTFIKFENDIFLYESLNNSNSTIEDLILKIKEDRSNLLTNYESHAEKNNIDNGEHKKEDINC